MKWVVALVALGCVAGCQSVGDASNDAGKTLPPPTAPGHTDRAVGHNLSKGGPMMGGTQTAGAPVAGGASPSMPKKG
ncbi:MAG: hypothetical protein ACYC96_02855 [Fimbriimonadaceae bacterium]